MLDETQSPVIFSPRAVRALHLTLAALAVVSLALQMWNWTRPGQDGWTGFLAPLGFLIMGVGGSIDPAFRRWYQALYFVGVGFIAADLIMALRAL